MAAKKSGFSGPAAPPATFEGMEAVGVQIWNNNTKHSEIRMNLVIPAIQREKKKWEEQKRKY